MKNLLAEIEEKEGRKFDSIVMESSPFMRVMTTASIVAKELSIDNIKIDWLHSEYNCPIPKIEFKNKTLEEIDEEYDLGGIRFEDSDCFREEALTWYPEREKDGLKRA